MRFPLAAAVSFNFSCVRKVARATLSRRFAYCTNRPKDERWKILNIFSQIVQKQMFKLHVHTEKH